MGQIKINNIIYGTTSASEIIYKNTTVEEKLDTIPVFDINDNSNVSPSSDVLTYGNIIDNLNSSATDKVLSANQGRVLRESIENIDFSPLEAAIDNNSIAIDENKETINTIHTQINNNIDSINNNIDSINNEINEQKNNIGVLDWSKKILIPAFVNSTSSYTAPDNGFLIGLMRATASSCYIFLYSNLMASSARWVGYGSASSYMSINIPVNKGEILTSKVMTTLQSQDVYFIPYKK